MTVRTRLWIRAGLILLTVVDLVLGFWAYLFPHSFYTGVPTVAADLAVGSSRQARS